jgi:precorrin-8X/cobalt-precorrin-8 methylmutase
VREVARLGRRVIIMGNLLERYGLPPASIECSSLSYVLRELECCLPSSPALRGVAARIVYATADLSLVPALRLHPRAADAGLAALAARRPVIVDARMLAAAVDRGPLARLGCPTLVAISSPGAEALARADGITRAAAGIRLLAESWANAIVAIGTAPTALLALLDLLDAGATPPALIIGLPVGFVAASEAKAELLRRAVPYVTLVGTRGGAGMAAAALNALALQVIVEPVS